MKFGMFWPIPSIKISINLETDNSNILYNTCSLLLTNCVWRPFLFGIICWHVSAKLKTPDMVHLYHDLKKRLLESTQFNSTLFSFRQISYMFHTTHRYVNIHGYIRHLNTIYRLQNIYDNHKFKIIHFL